jgi:hypothetical protein
MGSEMDHRKPVERRALEPLLAGLVAKPDFATARGDRATSRASVSLPIRRGSLTQQLGEEYFTGGKVVLQVRLRGQPEQGGAVGRIASQGRPPAVRQGFGTIVTHRAFGRAHDRSRLRLDILGCGGMSGDSEQENSCRGSATHAAVTSSPHGSPPRPRWHYRRRARELSPVGLPG